MKAKDIVMNHSRRKFLTEIIPSCSLACVGLGSLNVLGSQDKADEQIGIHKFQKDWVQSYEDVFRLRFRYYIQIMKRFANYLGRENLIEMIKQATDEYILDNPAYDSNFNFTEWLSGGKEYFKNMMTWEIVEETDKTYEMKVSECLWAKIFQEYDAADIGYATICYSDFADAKATHPKLRLERTKTIMEGHGYCNHRWILGTRYS